MVIQEYTEKTSVFKFGPTNHKINEPGSSVIFELKGPNKKKTKSADCASCKVVTFQKEKHIEWCDFCGCSVCKECLGKERPFLNVEIDKDGKRARGRVCKLCDRKILVRQMLLKS